MNRLDKILDELVERLVPKHVLFCEMQRSWIIRGWNEHDKIVKKENNICVAGCSYYSGHEVKHHKDCVHYNHSFSQMFDRLKESEKKLIESLERISKNECDTFVCQYNIKAIVIAKQALKEHKALKGEEQCTE